MLIHKDAVHMRRNGVDEHMAQSDLLSETSLACVCAQWVSTCGRQPSFFQCMGSQAGISDGALPSCKDTSYPGTRPSPMSPPSQARIHFMITEGLCNSLLIIHSSLLFLSLSTE